MKGPLVDDCRGIAAARASPFFLNDHIYISTSSDLGRVDRPTAEPTYMPSRHEQRGQLYHRALCRCLGSVSKVIRGTH